MAFTRHRHSDDPRQLLIDWSVSQQPHGPFPTVVRRYAYVRRSSCLPVPRPLRTAVAAGIFGHNENGKPVCPSREEVRAITERHAENMIDMNDAELQAAGKMYAEDFGEKAALQLERYVRRQQHSRGMGQSCQRMSENL
jgi:hypothetical protein